MFFFFLFWFLCAFLISDLRIVLSSFFYIIFNYSSQARYPCLFLSLALFIKPPLFLFFFFFCFYQTVQALPLSTDYLYATNTREINHNFVIISLICLLSTLVNFSLIDHCTKQRKLIVDYY